MPIVNFHLVEGCATPAQADALLQGATTLYAGVLAAPIDRIRAFITEHRPGHFTVGGVSIGRSGAHAPFFEVLVLEGRTPEQRLRLLSGFTELLVEVLGVDRALVRGCCHRVPPEDWAIAGVPASVARGDEVRARAEAARPHAVPGAG